MEPRTYSRASKLTSTDTQPHLEPAAASSSPIVGESLPNLNLSPDQLSTPEVQCVVVEHIVKSTDITSQFNSPAKLR